MARVRVEVDGLDGFRRGLRQADRSVPASMGRANRRAADLLARRAKSASPPHVARAVSGRGGPREGIVRVGPRPLHALGTVMGAKQRFGWYTLPPYKESTGRQFPPWVGNAWDPGERGGMPYHVGGAINRSVDDVEDVYADEFERGAAAAFPRGR